LHTAPGLSTIKEDYVRFYDGGTPIGYNLSEDVELSDVFDSHVYILEYPGLTGADIANIGVGFAYTTDENQYDVSEFGYSESPANQTTTPVHSPYGGLFRTSGDWFFGDNVGYLAVSDTYTLTHTYGGTRAIPTLVRTTHTGWAYASGVKLIHWPETSYLPQMANDGLGGTDSSNVSGDGAMTTTTVEATLPVDSAGVATLVVSPSASVGPQLYHGECGIATDGDTLEPGDWYVDVGYVSLSICYELV
jgi:hypothetical protein